MKKIILSALLVLAQAAVFSQTKLPDGIYLVDEAGTKNISPQKNTAAIQFNPLFVEEDPAEYDPVLIFTHDFVPLQLTKEPVIQLHQKKEHLLLVTLTEVARQKLSSFTSKHITKQVVVLVNGQALAIYRVTKPVTSKEIRISKCTGDGCSEVYRYLKSTIRFL
ncbi:MAG: hypothetical protein WAT19_14655 [Ferruginibacter sp.]